MPSSVINNRYKSCVLHASGANASFVIAGNNSVSNITSASNQVITGASITRLWFGVGNGGHWNVKRGANLVLTVSDSGFLLFDGAPVTNDKTANVSFELIGSANGFIMAEIHKEGNLE